MSMCDIHDISGISENYARIRADLVKKGVEIKEFDEPIIAWKSVKETSDGAFIGVLQDTEPFELGQKYKAQCDRHGFYAFLRLEDAEKFYNRFPFKNEVTVKVQLTGIMARGKGDDKEKVVMAEYQTILEVENNDSRSH